MNEKDAVNLTNYTRWLWDNDRQTIRANQYAISKAEFEQIKKGEHKFFKLDDRGTIVAKS